MDGRRIIDRLLARLQLRSFTIGGSVVGLGFVEAIRGVGVKENAIVVAQAWNVR